MLWGILYSPLQLSIKILSPQGGYGGNYTEEERAETFSLFYACDLASSLDDLWPSAIYIIIGRNVRGKLEVADIFSKYASSVVAIGWAYFRKAEDINVPKEMLLEGHYGGQTINVLPCASSFVLSIDENRTLLATANHAFPNPDIDKATICLIVMPQKCPYEVNMEDIAAYPGLLRYTRFAEQDLCLFEVETPEALYLQSPAPFTLSFDFKVGDEVCSIGYPFIGFEGHSQGQRDIRFIERLTCAHLCSVWADVKKRALILEFDNYIGPGNSGGGH